LNYFAFESLTIVAIEAFAATSNRRDMKHSIITSLCATLIALGTNFCHIGIKVVPRTNTLIIVSVIDNLVKGASGQAVHNMNIMMGFDETAGLESPALFP